MFAVLRSRKVKLRTAPDNDAPMLDELFQNGFERQRLRLNAVQKRDHIEMKSALKIRIFKKIIQHFLRIGVSFEINCYLQSFFIRFIPYVADPFQFLFMHELRHANNKLRFIYLIRNGSNQYLPVTVFPLRSE